ncbi:protogloblin ApPgb [Carbonactinospora thermoautotrophica]|uniref:protoglobin domain-containing protein n=1 Tax=Carbonactinospora thermoautotrophica TaxID=1469144 RepID=UPI00227100C7|nr:protoglobin domain-containing protein [Carbonactinospora thermoautotrophica]MCX9192859.1 protogloblin ApPgb [Carbonactinospora thermoautotrophica]
MSQATTTIPGYTYDSPQKASSPVTEEDLSLLLSTLLWTEEDERALRRAGEVLADQVERILDVWYGYVGSHPHLVHYFAGPDGKPIDEYLARVRSRFEQWVRDLCQRPRDRAWLDYQEEIALRHTRTKKNHTDGVEAAPEIPLRYMIAFIYPITATIREFLAAKGDPEETVEAMYQAWFKSVVLSMTLWARPYVEQRW